MATCMQLRRKDSKALSVKSQGGWFTGSNESPPVDPSVERKVTEGQLAAIYSQRFVLGVSPPENICIPLHLRLRDDNKTVKWKAARRRKEGIKRAGWVIWIDEDTNLLCSTTVSQWVYSSRSKWLQDCEERYEQRCALRREAATKIDTKSSDNNPTTTFPPIPPKNCDGSERRVLHLFVLLHGMSPPALLQTDVVENFGNLIATVLQRFPRSPRAPQSSALLTHSTDEPSTSQPTGAPRKSGVASGSTESIPNPEEANANGGTDGEEPASVLFVIYSFRSATWQSVAACMDRIVPLLSAELSILLKHWDEIKLFAVGHSLGGLLWRFVLLRRLQQLIYPDGGPKQRNRRKTPPPEYGTLLVNLQHPKLHLTTFCTLASPHVGAYKSSAVYRSMPRAVAGLRFLPNSDYAQELLLHNDKGYLAALATEEHAGRSHLTFPFSRAQADASSSEALSRRGSLSLIALHSRSGSVDIGQWQQKQSSKSKGTVTTNEVVRQKSAQQGVEAEARQAERRNSEENKKGDGKASTEHKRRSSLGNIHGVGHEYTPETHDVPGEVSVLALNRFEKVLLYGILETDWIVSANSALATAVDLRRTPEGRLAIENPMYPIHLKSVSARSSASLTNPQGSEGGKLTDNSINTAKSVELMLAQQHIDVFNHVSSVDRYIVYIDQNPLFLAPHATLKGSPCIVTEAEQRRMRKEAAPILEHVAAHLLQIHQQYNKRIINRTPPGDASKIIAGTEVLPIEDQTVVAAAESKVEALATTEAALASVSAPQPILVAE